MANEIYLPYKEQLDDVNAALYHIANTIEGGGDYTGYDGMQRAVRSGMAATQFPVGSQFIVHHATYGDRICEVLAHDYLKAAHDPNAHTMTCRFKNLLSSQQFDESEAFYYAEQSIPAGTYNFTIATAYSQWAAGTYQFTLTQALPKGGQLGISVNNADSAITNATVQAFASQNATTPTESVAITAGSGGTALGTLGDGLNHPYRICYGSNNYKESALRQHLNSDKAAGSVWKPQTRYDRPPSWAGTLAGLLAGFDADFLATVGEVNLPCTANQVFESQDSAVQVGTAYTLHDRFYLLSQNEMFGTKPFAADESLLLPYFVGATNADRIGYLDNGNPASQWLRTPNPSNGNYVRYCNSSGALSSNYARYAYAYAPAFTII